MSAHYKIYLWKRAPFVRLLIPLIAGILIQFYLPLPPLFLLLAAISLFIPVCTFRYLSNWLHYRFSYLRGVCISLLFVVLGAAFVYLKNAKNHPSWYGHHLTPASLLWVTVQKPPEEKAKTFKFLAEVQTVIDPGRAIATTGYVVLYVSKDSVSRKLNYGDELILKNRLRNIKNTGNPGAFDYAGYMAKQQIFQEAFYTAKDYQPTGVHNKNFFYSNIFAARHFILIKIDRYIEGNREQALTKALLIGYRQDVDKELLQAYSNAGVIHLVAISGLHLGIIYGMLLFFMGKIPFFKRRNILRVAIILLSMWIFALVTGASPSVLRAACMFSFISIGSLFKTRPSIYNSLAASAFMLLTFDPFILWNAGFQLSYLAVIGIVSLQKPIYHLLYIPNKFTDFFWQIASVSIAAQIFTLPLCLYYFHQFPLLFLLANLLLIPLATVVLWGSIILILISAFTPAAAVLGAAVGYAVEMMNQIVMRISSLSFSVWDMIHLNLPEMFVLYLIFISVFIWLHKQNKWAFKWALFFTLLLSLSFCLNDISNYHQKKLVIYNIAGKTAVDFLKSKRVLFKADDGLHTNKGLYAFHILPGRILYSVKNRAKPVAGTGNLFLFEGKRVLIVDSAYRQKTISGNFDHLILTQNSPAKLETFLPNIHAEMIIFDASNSAYKINQWKKECEELHLQYYSVPDEGAYIADIR